ncbi:HNH endonuclease [Nocardioides sp. AN3]
MCSICNTARATEADHIIPLRDGGTNTPENLRPVCRPCNLRRRQHRRR